MGFPCPSCDCSAPEGDAAHAVIARLRDDDLDGAMQQGLLDAMACPCCAAACVRRMLDCRATRRAALLARDRHTARQARLARRAAQRDRGGIAQPGRSTTALPDAAADALARALARAALRRRP